MYSLKKPMEIPEQSLKIVFEDWYSTPWPWLFNSLCTQNKILPEFLIHKKLNTTQLNCLTYISIGSVHSAHHIIKIEVFTLISLFTCSLLQLLMEVRDLIVHQQYHLVWRIVYNWRLVEPLNYFLWILNFLPISLLLVFQRQLKLL